MQQIENMDDILKKTYGITINIKKTAVVVCSTEPKSLIIKIEKSTTFYVFGKHIHVLKAISGVEYYMTQKPG